MATVTDTLETLLKVTGAAAYRREQQQIATYWSAVAKAEGEMDRMTDHLGATLERVGQVAGGVVVAGITAATAAATTSIKVFESYEATLRRASLVLGNMGAAFPTDELARFADKMGEAAGVSSEAILNLARIMGEFGLSRSQIERFSPAIMNASRELGKSAEQIFAIVEAARLGSPRGLRQLGLPALASRGSRIPIPTTLAALDHRYAGAAAEIRGTGEGSREALSAATERLERTIGQKLDPDLNRFREDLTASLNLLSKRLHESTASPYSSPFAAVAHYIRESAKGMHDLGYEIGRRQRGRGGMNQPHRMEQHAAAARQHLKDIAFNTSSQGPIVQGASRGGGPFGRGAVNIRAFNQVFRNSG